MLIKIRKTTYDSEVGRVYPGMIKDTEKDISLETAGRWVQFRIAEVVENGKTEDIDTERHETEEELQEPVTCPLDEPCEAATEETEETEVKLEEMTKAEIRAMAEDRGIQLPNKLNKEDMIKRVEEHG